MEEDDFVLDLIDLYFLYDLMVIFDGLIIDYFLVIFEYSFLKCLMYFYCLDLEDYLKECDFYYLFELFVFGLILKDVLLFVYDIESDYEVDMKWIEVFLQMYIIY